MNLYKTMKKFLLLSIVLVLAACSEDENPVAPELVSPQSVTYDSRCQADTIRFSVAGAWTATVSDEWVTLRQTKGSGEGMVPLYIQQNDDERQRRAVVTIATDKGDTLKVSLTQRMPDANGSSDIDFTENFGLGWGYDLNEDVADIKGLRGQVFDHSLLSKYNNSEDAFAIDNAAFTDLQIKSGNSHLELQGSMGARFSGEADLFIAGAKVSVEYSDQINQSKDTRYVWCRDMRGVKMAYLFNLDYGDPDLVKKCTTESFRYAVENNSVDLIVHKFGTHVVISSTLGGKYDYYFTMSKTVETEIERVVTYVQVKVLFIKKSWTDVDETVWTNIQTDFQGRFHVTGGGEVGRQLDKKLEDTTNQGIPMDDDALFIAWSKCFEDPNTAKLEDLAMIDFEVIPIWEIIEPLDTAKAQAVKNYVIKNYLSQENALKQQNKNPQ